MVVPDHTAHVVVDLTAVLAGVVRISPVLRLVLLVKCRGPVCNALLRSVTQSVDTVLQ